MNYVYIYICVYYIYYIYMGGAIYRLAAVRWAVSMLSTYKDNLINTSIEGLSMSDTI